jgi:enamine deaminase RidA (YjgF/YER057c/UK114 family)
MAHQIITALELGEPVGYTHAVVAAPGRTVFLGGQTALAPDGAILGATLPEQFAVAAANLVTALRAAGGEPNDICSMQIFVTDPADYKRHLPELGRVWRKHFGRRYPASGLFGVTRLFDEEAVIELMAGASEEPCKGGRKDKPCLRELTAESVRKKKMLLSARSEATSERDSGEGCCPGCQAVARLMRSRLRSATRSLTRCWVARRRRRRSRVRTDCWGSSRVGC